MFNNLASSEESFFINLHIFEIDLGMTFAATEITPCVPIFIDSMKVGSSPEYIKKLPSEFLEISTNSLILVISSTASFIPTMFLWLERMSTVLGCISQAVLDGTLYKI